MRVVKASRGRIQYPYTESVRGYDFGRRVYADTSKKEATWCRMLWHYNAEYDSTLRSRKLRRVVIRDAFCTLRPRSTVGTMTSAT